MREAALTLARGRDDFAPSLAARAVAVLRDLPALIRRRRAAARALAHLERLDADRLADIGLVPDDLAPRETVADPLAETRRLARAARARILRDRWVID